MTTEPRAYTTEEVREQFLKQVSALVLFWETVPDEGPEFSRAYGVAHSILSMLDGCSMQLPKFAIIADPHPDDEEHYKKEGENYYVNPYPRFFDIEIYGPLHEGFHAVYEQVKKETENARRDKPNTQSDGCQQGQQAPQNTCRQSLEE